MKKKLLTFMVVVVLVFALSGCSSKNYDLPIASSGQGFFTFILVRPIGYIMNFFCTHMGGYFAVGIVFTTLIVRTIAWPVYSKTNDMSLKMQLAQPELNRIQQKYVTRKDPMSQQKMQMEMLAVWKKYKINPLGCLIAPLIQMPLFMAMYQVVKRFPIYENGDVKTMFTTNMNQSLFGIIELDRGINFSNLGSISEWAYLILPALVGITMLIQQIIAQKKPSYAKKIPTPAVNDQAQQTEKMMKIMMYVMIVSMVAMSLSNSALALYWVVGNTYSLLQSIINRKMNEIKFEKLKQQSSII